MVSMEYILLSRDKLKDLRAKFLNRQLTHKGGGGGGLAKGGNLQLLHTQAMNHQQYHQSCSN